jgi:hypothetical protein
MLTFVKEIKKEKYHHIVLPKSLVEELKNRLKKKKK